MFLYKNQVFIEKHEFNVYYIHLTQKITPDKRWKTLEKKLKKMSN